jgi:hypothetical protein
MPYTDPLTIPAAADRFFAELDPPEPGNPIDPQPSVQLAIPGAGADRADPERVIGERASKLQAISMDMGPGYALSAREHAPNAVICIDPFHVVALTTRALDEVRRGYWNELRSWMTRTPRNASRTPAGCS